MQQMDFIKRLMDRKEQPQEEQQIKLMRDPTSIYDGSAAYAQLGESNLQIQDMLNGHIDVTAGAKEWEANARAYTERGQAVNHTRRTNVCHELP